MRGPDLKIQNILFSSARVTKQKPHPNNNCCSLFICSDVLQTECGLAPNVLKEDLLVDDVVRADTLTSARLQTETPKSLFKECFCRHPLLPQGCAKESALFLHLFYYLEEEREKCYGSIFFNSGVFLTLMSIMFIKHFPTPGSSKCFCRRTLSVSHSRRQIFQHLIWKLSPSQEDFPPSLSLLLLCAVLSVNKGTWEF